MKASKRSSEVLQEIREMLNSEATSVSSLGFKITANHSITAAHNQFYHEVMLKRLCTDSEQKKDDNAGNRSQPQLLKQVVIIYPLDGPYYSLVMGRDLLRLNHGCPLNGALIRFGLLYIMQEKIASPLRSSILLFDHLYGAIDKYPKLSPAERKLFREYHTLGDKNFLVFLVRMDGQSEGGKTTMTTTTTSPSAPDHPTDGHHWYLAVVSDIKAYQGPPCSSSVIPSTVTFLDSNQELGSAHYKWASAGVRAYLRDVYSDLHGASIHIRLTYRVPLLPQHEADHDSGLYLLSYFEAFFRKSLLRDRVLNKQPIGKVRLFNGKFNSSDLRFSWRCVLFDKVDTRIDRYALMRQLKWKSYMLDKYALERTSIML